MWTGEQQARTAHRLAEVNHFAAQMDHFSDCVLHDKQPLTPGEDGLDDVRVVDAVNEAARSGKTVRL